MNKYQEALNNLIKVSCPKGRCCKECDFEKICNCEAKSYIDTLQELVDKATPKKADIWGDGYDDEGNLIYDMYDAQIAVQHTKLIITIISIVLIAVKK